MQTHYSPSRQAEKHFARIEPAETFEQAKTRYMLALEGEDITNELQGTPADCIAMLLQQDDSDAKVGAFLRRLMENQAERLAQRDVKPRFPRRVALSADQMALALMAGRVSA